MLVCLVLSADPARALDEARIEANVAAAIAKYGVSGTGVVVAILDRGIDWTNNDFRNPDGTTRIAAILDLTDDTGAYAAGNPYGKGTLYTRSQIDAALLAGTPLAIRDAVGHGTATAGIAVGNGRNSVGGKYRGIAPNATIIIVKITSDGAPAHDDQLAEAPFYDPSRIPVAIDFVRAQASALGMPCVMLLNLGSQGGPTDGSSSLARKIDSVVGPGIPGLVFVTGTGDDGGSANRAGGNVVAGGDSAIRILKGTSGPLYFDLWYGRADRFDVTIQGPSGTSGPYASPPSDTSLDTQTTTDFVYYHFGSDLTPYGPQTNKREIWIQLTGAPGTYTVTLHRNASAGDGRFDATLNPSQIWNPPSNTNSFLSFVSPGSIWDGAAARNNIAPNAYTFRTSWIDIDGISRTLTGNGNRGEIWPGSSVGPTFDGRLGVDVSAPGEEVVTAYAPKSYWATFRFNLVNDGDGLYGLAGAVSAAAPMVTGVIALMLEMNPNLDAAQVKSLLHHARADAFTGAVPNTTWGYGKLDALRVLEALAGNAPALTVNTTMAPPGSPVMLTLTNGAGGPTDWIALAGCTSPLTTYVSWFYAGTGVTSHTWTVTLPATLGCYEFRLFSNNGFTQLAESPSITVANINPTPAITAISPGSIVAGSAAGTLTVSGTGFASGAVVQVDGNARSTTYVNATRVTAALLADDVATAGISHTITVVNLPVCAGSVCTSNGATLDVTPPPPPPTIAGIDPTTVIAGNPGFTLTVYGTDFAANSVVQVNGIPRPTTFVDATSLTTPILASDIASGTISSSFSGSLSLAWDPSPGDTAGYIVLVGPALGLYTRAVDVGNQTSAVVGGLADRQTYYFAVQAYSALGATSELSSAVSGSAASSTPQVMITVVTPAPGGGTSNSVPLTVFGPALTVSVTTVPVAGPVQTTFSSGPGGANEWIALYPASTTGVNGYVDWQWTTGGQGIGGVATTGTLTFPTGGRTLPAGQYVMRWIGAGNVILAQSAVITFAVINPTPVLTGIGPSSVAAGSAAFGLTVTGTGFVNGALVQVDGSARPTTFGSATQLLAALPAGDVTTAGTTHTITVVNPSNCVGNLCTSNGVPLNVTTPPAAPTLTAISPTSVAAGGPAFALTVTGTDFAGNSVVQVNGVARPTTFGSATSLTATVPASDIASGGTLNIIVVTPAPGGGTSSSLPLTVVGPGLTLSATTVPVAGPVQVAFANGPGKPNEWIALYPASTTGIAGYTDWQWTSGGQGPPSAATTGTLTFPTGGRPVPTGTYVFRWISATNTILAQSPVVTFAVINPTPSIVQISPDAIPAGSPDTTITVTGAGFVIGAVVQLDGSPRTTTFVSSTSLKAMVLSSDVPDVGGSRFVTVANPPACVGNVCTSNFLGIWVTMPPDPPTLTAISPASIAAGGPAFTLTVTGTFAGTSIVQVNGSNRPTTYVSPISLTAAIPASDIASGGTLTITVVTPAPGGGTSSSLPLTVVGPGLTLSATTVPVAGPVQVTFANGPGNANEWIGLYPAIGVAGFTDWQWATGGQGAHGTATTGTLTFPTGGRTLPPGNYVFRWISSTNTILAQSAVITFAVINPTPVITAISPSGVAAGSATFALTVTGTGFVTGAVVQVDGSTRPTTFGSATQLLAALPAGDVTTAGTTHTIAVVNPSACVGSVCASNGVTLNVTTPPAAPTLTSITPTTVAAGGPAFALTATGTDFAGNSVVQVNGVARTTTFGSATSLTATVPASDIASGGILSITVFTPAPGGGTSNSAALTVVGPTLTVSATTVPVAGPVQTTFSNGPGRPSEWVALFPASTSGITGYVDWQWTTGGQTMAGTATSGTLTFPTGGKVLTPGTYVFRWISAGAVLAQSAPVAFQVINPTPTLATVNPNGIAAGSTGFTLTVTGTGFVTGAVVQVDGSPRPTTFASATQLLAALPAADLTTAGVSCTIMVVNPSACVGSVCTSNGVPLNVTTPPAAPTVTSINPTTVAAGGPAFALTVTGTDFAGNSVVLVNGMARPTTFGSATSLTATMPASDIASGGTPTITVVTPAPGGGTSNSAALGVLGPTLTVSATTVPVAGPVQVTFTNGPGNGNEWIGLYPATGVAGFTDWQWATGGQGAHGTATTGTLTFPTGGRTLPPGNYVFRWISSTNTILAQSPVVTFDVMATSP
jgi:hypothetical protein